MTTNQKLYDASMQFLTESGVPVSAAERASEVVANDDPYQPNLGRTAQDQKDITDAMTWMNAEKISSSS
jgi:hypothetical protein